MSRALSTLNMSVLIQQIPNLRLSKHCSSSKDLFWKPLQGDLDGWWVTDGGGGGGGEGRSLTVND